MADNDETQAPSVTITPPFAAPQEPIPDVANLFPAATQENALGPIAPSVNTNMDAQPQADIDAAATATANATPNSLDADQAAGPAQASAAEVAGPVDQGTQPHPFEGISSDHRVLHGQADIDRWNNGLRRQDELNAQEDALLARMDDVAADYKAARAAALQAGADGKWNIDALTQQADVVRDQYKIEDMQKGDLGEFADDMAQARNGQMRILAKMNGDIEKLTSDLNADKAVGLAGGAHEMEQPEAQLAPSEESALQKKLTGLIEGIDSQRATLAAVVKLAKHEELTAEEEERLSRDGKLQELKNNYASRAFTEADQKSVDKYDQLLQSQRTDYVSMLQEEQKYQTDQSAWKQAANVDKRYGETYGKVIDLNARYQDEMLDALKTHSNSHTQWNAKAYAVQMAPAKAVYEAKMESLQEQASQVNSARIENSANISFDSWQKAHYAGGKDISDQIIMKNDKGNVMGFDLPKDAEVVTKIDDAGKLEVTIRAANWQKSKARDGADPDFQAVTFTGLSKDDVESLRFNAHAYGTNRFVFEGPKPKNLALTFNVDVADGVDIRNNRDMSVRNINDGAVYAPQASAYSSDPNWKPPSKEELEARREAEEAKRMARVQKSREHDAHSRNDHGNSNNRGSGRKHPTRMADADHGNDNHPFANLDVGDAGRSLLNAGTGTTVAHADAKRLTGRDAYNPSHSSGKGPSTGGPAVV